MYIYWIANETNKTLSDISRYQNYSKSSILRKSWLSLQQNVTDEDKICIIADNVSDKTLKWLDSKSTCLTETVRVENSKVKYPFFLQAINTLEKHLENSNSSDIHYITFDDWLFTTNAFNTLKTNAEYWEGFGILEDNPNRYAKPQNTYVFQGVNQHWKIVHTSDISIFAKSRIWKYTMPRMKNVYANLDYEELQRIYQEIPCICPIPGTATHLKETEITPYVDWNFIWNGLKY